MRWMVVAAEATIVVPQYGRAELTCACIASLRERERVPWPVIVVDDGSGPGCIESLVERRFPATRIVRQSHAGVTAAWNCGAAHVETPLIVFLNNDVLFDGPAVERLVAPVRDGRSLVSGIRLRREVALPGAVLRKLPTDRFVEGWCFAVATETLRRAGGFDPAMRVYWSDTDLQARLLREEPHRREALACQPELPLRHLGHRTAHRLAGRSAVWRADRAAFVAKWSSL